MTIREQIEKLQQEAYAEIQDAFLKRDNTRVSFMTGKVDAFAVCLDLLEQSEGEWIYIWDDGFPIALETECSVCHKREVTLDHEHKYCPNCGARMKGGE